MTETKRKPRPKRMAAREAEPVRLQISELLQGGRVAILEYDGQDYRLRITANGKLILTK